MLRNITVAAALLFAACEGKQGPVGPPGPNAKNIVWVDSTGAQVTLDGFVDLYGFAHHLDASNDMYPVNVTTGSVVPPSMLVGYDNAQCTGSQRLIPADARVLGSPYPLEVFTIQGQDGYWERPAASSAFVADPSLAAVMLSDGGCDSDLVAQFSSLNVIDFSTVTQAPSPPSDWKGPLHLEYR